MLKIKFLSKSILFILFAICVSLYAGADMTGYSGAPGTQGTCAGKCHGASNGTIIVNGFPKIYVPGQTYVITVIHTGGKKISNFNGSVRIGTTKKYAGTISADYQTSIYNIAAESNGVHLTSPNKDTGIFYWTAPQLGVGEVKLYLAGMQGTTAGGLNTKIILSSNQAKTFSEDDTNLVSYLSIQLDSEVVKDSIIINISLPQMKDGQIKLLNNNRLIMDLIKIPKSENPTQTIICKAFDKDSNKLPDGSYIASLTCESEQVIKKFEINNK